jgi:parvulin-like peptidyl-prolyl isomerase
VEYLKLDYSALKEADLSQETLRAYYDAHQEEFRKPQVIKEGEKVENTKPEYFAFEEAKERIKDILLKEAAKNKLEALIDQLSEKAQDWKAFASAQGLTYNETGLFTQAQPVPGIPFCWQFVDTAFKLSTGQMANEAILGPQSAYIIRLKEKKAPFIQGLEEVKAKVKEKVLLENAVKLANEKAQAELKEIQEKKLSLEEAAAKLALEVKKEKGIKNTGYIKGIGPSENFAEIAFSLKPGEIGGVASTAGGSCILRLDSYQGIDENKFNAEKEKYKTLVLEDKREAVFNQWLGSLLEKAKFEDNLVNLKKTAQSR